MNKLSSITPNKLILFLLANEIFVPRISLGVSWLTLDDVIPLITALLGLLMVVQIRWAPKRLLLLFLIAWSFIGVLSSLINTNNSTEFISSFAKGGLRPVNSLLLIIYVYKIVQDNPQLVQFTLAWIARAGFALGLFSIITYSAALMLNRPVYGIFPWTGGSSVSRLVPGRFIGTSNVASNFIGAYFVMVVPVTLALALTAEDKNKKRFYSIGVLLQLFGMVVTFTRMSMIALVIVTIGMLILLRKKSLLQLLAAVGIVGGSIVTLTIPEYILRYTTDSTGRLFLWGEGLKMMLDNPWIGVGFNRYMTVVFANPLDYQFKYNPHNSWVLMGAEGGIFMFAIGIGLVLIYMLSVFGAYMRSGTKTGRTLITGLMAGAAGFIIHNMTNDLLYLPHLTTYFWLFYALAMNMPGQKNATQAESPPASEMIAEPAAV